MDEPVELPNSMRLAVRLMWLGAALSVAGIVAVFLDADGVRQLVVDQVESGDASLSSREIDDVTSATLTVFGLLGLLVAVLWLWMAAANGDGRPWARRMATVLGSAYLAGTAVRLVRGGDTGSEVGSTVGAVLTLLTLVVAVGVLILLYRPESARYYREMSAAGDGSSG